MFRVGRTTGMQKSRFSDGYDVLQKTTGKLVVHVPSVSIQRVGVTLVTRDNETGVVPTPPPRFYFTPISPPFIDDVGAVCLVRQRSGGRARKRRDRAKVFCDNHNAPVDRRGLLASQTSRLLVFPIRLATTQECSGEIGWCLSSPRRITGVGEDSRWRPETPYTLPQPIGRQSLTEVTWPSVRERREARTTTGDCGTTAGESWIGDRDAHNFEPPKLAVRNLDPRSAAIVDKCSLKIRPQLPLEARQSSPTLRTFLPGVGGERSSCNSQDITCRGPFNSRGQTQEGVSFCLSRGAPHYSFAGGCVLAVTRTPMLPGISFPCSGECLWVVVYAAGPFRCRSFTSYTSESKVTSRGCLWDVVYAAGPFRCRSVTSYTSESKVTSSGCLWDVVYAAGPFRCLSFTSYTSESKVTSSGCLWDVVYAAGPFRCRSFTSFTSESKVTSSGCLWHVVYAAGPFRCRSFTSYTSESGYRRSDRPISASSLGDGLMRKDDAPRVTLAYVGVFGILIPDCWPGFKKGRRYRVSTISRRGGPAHTVSGWHYRLACLSSVCPRDLELRVKRIVTCSWRLEVVPRCGEVTTSILPSSWNYALAALLALVSEAQNTSVNAAAQICRWAGMICARVAPANFNILCTATAVADASPASFPAQMAALAGALMYSTFDSEGAMLACRAHLRSPGSRPTEDVRPISRVARNQFVCQHGTAFQPTHLAETSVMIFGWLLTARSSEPMRAIEPLPSIGAAVVWWLDYLPPAKVNRFRFPEGSPTDFRMWESRRTVPLVGWFSRGPPVSPSLAFSVSSHLSQRLFIQERYASVIAERCPLDIRSKYRAGDDKEDEYFMFPAPPAPKFFWLGNEFRVVPREVASLPRPPGSNIVPHTPL
ncbi:hypothetical protein PR048_008089 [Dryococelus australis]|uniref:Uncharacterized protein n=1 Tax=Dryococelus australis TaxID=614101 RepID=A0ABQ9HW48_9NEOP|nr:hypothetical protein PR048_008089 [Dryococelus australis]